MTSAVGLRIIHKNTSRKIACKACRSGSVRVFILLSQQGLQIGDGGIFQF